MPIQKYAADRSLREETYRAFVTRASDQSPKGADNALLIVEILNLRQRKAELLGYKNFAEVSCASKMASPQDAISLMDKLRESAMEPAKREREELLEYARSKGMTGDMNPWDEGYYAELYRQETLAFNEEDLRPYLSLPTVLKGMFGLAKRLFDVDLTQVRRETRHVSSQESDRGGDALEHRSPCSDPYLPLRSETIHPAGLWKRQYPRMMVLGTGRMVMTCCAVCSYIVGFTGLWDGWS